MAGYCKDDTDRIVAAIEEVARLRAIASDWEGVALDRDKECFRLRAIVEAAKEIRPAVVCWAYRPTPAPYELENENWRCECHSCKAARRFDEAVGEE